MKEKILENDKIENLRTKIYLMVITLDLNLIENNDNKVYNKKEDLSEIFYCNLNKIENLTYKDNRENLYYNENFENLDK